MSGSGSDGRKRRIITRSVFYGGKPKGKPADAGEEASSMASVGIRQEEEEEKRDISFDSDDSVDDPDFMLGSDDDGDKDEPRPGVSGVVTQATGGHVSSDDDDDDDDGVGGSVGSVGAEVGEGSRGRARQRVRRPLEKKGKRAVRLPSLDDQIKKKRNLGQEYTSYRSGQHKVVSEKRVRSPCKDGCYELVDENARNTILKNFWEIGDYDKQNEYILRNVKVVEVKRRYGTGKRTMERKNYDYFVTYEGKNIKICRTAFLNIHDLSRKRVSLQLHKMRASVTGTPPGDRRGKHAPAQKITGARLDRVHQHIQSLPTTTSHYRRAKSPHRLFLEHGLTVKQLYAKYVYWMEQNQFEEELVKEDYYRKIFTYEYNIGFKPPKKDTCTHCDRLKVQVEELASKEEDTSDATAAWEEHKSIARKGQDFLSEQKNVVPVQGELVVKTVAMDLQQTLPCPRLSTGLAYYLRKLWVYNFCIHDIQKGKASMFVWDEVTGGRGSDEVATCLMKWLALRQEEGEDFDVLRVFCDNCAGQNKNHYVLLTALRMIHEKKLMRVEIVFMVSGHSYLPCDRNFGVLEKKFRVAENIHTPQHYLNVIGTAVTTNPYEVIEMKLEEFMDIKPLLGYVTKRQPPVPFSSARQLVVDVSYKEGFILKTTYDIADTPRNSYRVRLMKGMKKYNSKLFDLGTVPLFPKNATPIKLKKKKVADLKKLRDFVGPASQIWWDTFITTQESLEGVAEDPDDPEDVESDSENDMDYYVVVRRRAPVARRTTT